VANLRDLAEKAAELSGLRAATSVHRITANPARAKKSGGPSARRLRSDD
jgi:hypothetical protein